MNNVLFVDDERHILHSMKLAFRNEVFNTNLKEKISKKFCTKVLIKYHPTLTRKFIF